MDVGIEHFTKQDDEVVALRWFSRDEIRKGEYKGNSFGGTISKYLDEF